MSKPKIGECDRCRCAYLWYGLPLLRNALCPQCKGALRQTDTDHPATAHPRRFFTPLSAQRAKTEPPAMTFSAITLLCSEPGCAEDAAVRFVGYDTPPEGDPPMYGMHAACRAHRHAVEARALDDWPHGYEVTENPNADEAT